MQHTTNNFQESFDYINELLSEHGQQPFTTNEAKDYNISGGETFQSLEELVNDFLSEIATEKAEAKHFNKYGY